MQAITPPVQQFIERMGFLMERVGAAKTLGRVMGLLLVATRPLSMDELSTLLLVSKASISTNARICEQAGFVQRVGVPGDRRTYYEILPGSFGRVLEARNAIIGEFQQLAEEGIDAISPENSEARIRLEEMRDFYAFVSEGMEEMIATWKSASEKKRK